GRDPRLVDLGADENSTVAIGGGFAALAGQFVIGISVLLAKFGIDFQVAVKVGVHQRFVDGGGIAQTIAFIKNLPFTDGLPQFLGKRRKQRQIILELVT